MNILALDDERLILDDMLVTLKQVFDSAENEVVGFETSDDALNYMLDLRAHGEILDYAFLDINLRGITGIEFAKSLKDVQPDAKIIFCTAYSEYAYDAYKLHANGYLLKPVEAAQIVETLESINRDWKGQTTVNTREIRVQTFGNFELFIDNRPVAFQREKAKELFAYLIDRNGAAITTGEIVSILWEDRPNDKATINQAHAVISSMKKTLKELGAGNIIIKTWNHIAVDISKIKCDVYDFYKGDIIAINSYRGEYMAQYSWAEMTNADLLEKSRR